MIHIGEGPMNTGNCDGVIGHDYYSVLELRDQLVGVFIQNWVWSHQFVADAPSRLLQVFQMTQIEGHQTKVFVNMQ